MSAARQKPQPRSAARGCIALLAILFAVVASGCRTAPQLPPADFSLDGWQVRHGQAVWKPSKGRPELAGELIFATNTNGDSFVQFDKTPFTLAVGRVVGDRWQINLGGGRYVGNGKGQPPRRFAWFQLPRALAGEKLRSPWTFTQPANDSWRLENFWTGERLEGSLDP